MLYEVITRCRYFMNLCGGKNKNNIRRRFFNRFQKGIKSAVGEHMHFVNDIDLIQGTAWTEKNFILDLSDVVDTSIGSYNFV